MGLSVYFNKDERESLEYLAKKFDVSLNRTVKLLVSIGAKSLTKEAKDVQDIEELKRAVNILITKVFPENESERPRYIQ